MSDAARRAYDTDERTQPYEPEAIWAEADGISGFWSPLYRSGWVLAPPPRDPDIVRRVQAALIGASGAVGPGTAVGTTSAAELEWKCFSWDGDVPWYADTTLRDAGFAPGEEEAILVADSTVIAAGSQSRSDVTVRVAAGRTGDGVADEILNAADTVHRAVWGEGQPPSAIARGYWDGGGVCSIHVAYLGDQPVACGRFQASPGSRFGGLWGGATIPAARGRGCYRALVVSRAQEALRRELPWLVVDTNPDTSMPILLHNGFRAIGRSRPYTYSFESG